MWNESGGDDTGDAEKYRPAKLSLLLWGRRETFTMAFLTLFCHQQASEIAWMVDDSVDSFVNLELRKRDLESYVFAEEGNLWTNLIREVCRSQR